MIKFIVLNNRSLKVKRIRCESLVNLFSCFIYLNFFKCRVKIFGSFFIFILWKKNNIVFKKYFNENIIF